jgi:virulence factor
MIRLGLIGCGEHSESGHAIPLARLRDADHNKILLAAACDLQLERAQEFCRKYGFRAAYRSIDTMLTQESLDGCIAVVPPQSISEVGIRLLEKKIPCVVEKPLGTSLAEVSALKETAATTGTLNMVSVNRRFMPPLNRAIEWTRSAGPLRYVHCTMARHSRREPEFLWATAVHAVDTLRYIAGQVASADIQKLRPAAGTGVWYGINLQFENGIAARIDVVPTAGMVEETYDLFGEGFRASVTSPFGPKRGWRCFRDGLLISEETFAGDTPEDVVNGFYDEAAEFVRAVSSNSAAKPSISEVAPSIELCLALVDAQR